MNPDFLLNKLSGVIQVSSNRWLALCPGHDDRNPSLQITLGRSGDRLLVRDWGNCSLGEVLGPIGLRVCDLFENSARRSSPPRNYRISRAAFENAKYLINFYRADEKCGFLLGAPTATDLLRLREAAGIVREYRRERAR